MQVSHDRREGAVGRTVRGSEADIEAGSRPTGELCEAGRTRTTCVAMSQLDSAAACTDAAAVADAVGVIRAWCVRAVPEQQGAEEAAAGGEVGGGAEEQPGGREVLLKQPE